MTAFNFADRYAEAGLQPTGDQIALRREPVNAIVSNLTSSQCLDLAETYYGQDPENLNWFRDAFAEEDAAFSLVNNDREKRLLAALVLAQAIEDENESALLAVTTGSMLQRREPTVAGWLVSMALDAFKKQTVDNRKSIPIDPRIAATKIEKVTEAIEAITPNDVAGQQAAFEAVRKEASSSTQTVATKTSRAIAGLSRQLQLQREETQMLWWVIGNHSRQLGRSFSSIPPSAAALIAATDLGDLVSTSSLGPLAAPAMLARVVSGAKKAKGPAKQTLASAIDSLTREELESVRRDGSEKRPFLNPIATAIDLAFSMGGGKWHERFKTTVGLEASIEMGTLEIAEQRYLEHLLGRLV